MDQNTQPEIDTLLTYHLIDRDSILLYIWYLSSSISSRGKENACSLIDKTNKDMVHLLYIFQCLTKYLHKNVIFQVQTLPIILSEIEKGSPVFAYSLFIHIEN